ncbi:MAG TPA: type VI secretion system ImpA family N-terminal domain-containing protein, partial [Thermoanaerobaculia bacterium]|nr:type VI secretion system ImpA family N-terminal domain-containing protein [Thermoanaerobaculia bacterium]
MNPPRIDVPASRPAVDLETLLTPISADAPAGEPLRYSGLYDAVEAARREDDPELPQGVWQTALKRADWREVERLCLEALETRGKDLQVAAWLLEAWTRSDGLTGTLRGLALMAG